MAKKHIEKCVQKYTIFKLDILKCVNDFLLYFFMNDTQINHKL